MTTISSSTAATPATPAGAESVDAGKMAKFEDMLGQRMAIEMQKQQQSVNQSMTKLTDKIKKSMEDDE